MQHHSSKAFLIGNSLQSFMIIYLGLCVSASVAVIDPSILLLAIGLFLLIGFITFIIDYAAILKENPPGTFAQLFRMAAFSALTAYILGSFVQILFSPQWFLPNFINLGPAIAVFLFKSIDAGTYPRWFKRQDLYNLISDPTKTVQEQLRSHETIVGKAWKDIQGMASHNTMAFLLSLLLFLIVSVSAYHVAFAIPGVLIAAILWMYNGNILNQLLHEHQLFAINCPPQKSKNPDSRNLPWIIISLGLLIGLLLPFRTALIPIQALLAWLMSLVIGNEIPIETRKQLNTFFDSNYTQGNTLFPNSSNSVSPILANIGTILLYILAGLGIIVLLRILIWPLIKNPTDTIRRLLAFFKSLSTIFQTLFKQQKSDQHFKRLSYSKQALASAQSMLKAKQRIPRAWTNKIIKTYAAWISLFEKPGLTLHTADTPERILISIQNLKWFTAINDSAQKKIVEIGREINSIFAKECFSATGTELHEATQMEKLLKEAHEIIKNITLADSA